jgi:hypothetical protein
MRCAVGKGLVVGALLLMLAACSGDSVGRTVPVKGKVTVNGEPLKRGSVTFWPNDAKGNKSPHEAGAQIGADGTYEAFTKGKAGVPPGHYKVTISANADVDNTDPSKAKSLVPSIYNTKDTTPLLIEVVDNASPGAYDLPVK